FCSSRCGYCDFVTVVGHGSEHGRYVDAILRELALERAHLAPQLESIYFGGGTPTLTEAAALERLLRSLPVALTVTVEANPETVDPTLASLLRGLGVDRVSLGAQTFDARLLRTLDRAAQPADVDRAFRVLREAGFDNLSLDLIYGIPGQSRSDLERDLDQALRLEPEHVSAYELEAKPGTRFTHAHGAELARQSEAMESYFELVVARLSAAGYRWYETANFCRPGGRDYRAQHNLAYWHGRDYLGVGIGAVSTIAGGRRRNPPGLARYVAALERGEAPPRELEHIDIETRSVERVLLGLRLDEPLSLTGLESAVDGAALARLERLGLAHVDAETDGRSLVLTPRGRFLGGGVTAELLA
ncbi:MAG: radical SAM family heme chaperone HemW, partial [Gaiellaceae bacterium]